MKGETVSTYYIAKKREWRQPSLTCEQAPHVNALLLMYVYILESETSFFLSLFLQVRKCRGSKIDIIELIQPSAGKDAALSMDTVKNPINAGSYAIRLYL